MFSIPIRVYWEDTDAGGVVYHASYVRFLERARTEWLRAHGLEQSALREDEGVLLAIHAVQIDFLRPARLDDLLEVTAELSQRRSASFVMRQNILRGAERVVNAEVRVACLDRDFRPRPLPERLVAAVDGPQLLNATE